MWDQPICLREGSFYTFCYLHLQINFWLKNESKFSTVHSIYILISLILYKSSLDSWCEIIQDDYVSSLLISDQEVNAQQL